MSRLKKQERQRQLAEKLNSTPFVTDEELATYFSVSVPTIRLDRLELGIPELRERIKAMATEHREEEECRPDVVGELIDLTKGKEGLSILHTTKDMTDQSGYIDPQYLYAQANSLAKVVLGMPAALAGVGNIKHKNPVGAGADLFAKAEVVRKRGNKFFIWVIIKDRLREVFRAKFIMEPVEDRV